MYSSCIFCHGALGRNDVIDRFPTGRRLAFDPHKGRLWVICARCAGWNLTPLETRWEALEDCERLFRSTRARVFTDNIGLARVAPTLDLVRIGKALPPEFAAWRYGRTLRRRRAEMTALVVTSVAVGAGIAFGGMQTGLFAAGVLQAGVYAANIGAMVRHQRGVVARIASPEGGRLRIRGQDLRRARIQRMADGWRLQLQHATGTVSMSGRDAENGVRHLLPWLNRGGGSTRDVSAAVHAVEDAGNTSRFVDRLLTRNRQVDLPLGQLDTPGRLALEIAANEHFERLVLEGELQLLEREWREAEEVAAIADALD